MLFEDLKINTVSGLLLDTLKMLMDLDELKSFRLVGGTSLSLILGHRMSVDIDLFTDAPYGSIDFEQIDQVLLESFPIVQMNSQGNESFGKAYWVGHNNDELLKIDIFYHDQFVFPVLSVSNIRLSSLEEMCAMKLHVIGNNGRKKDFWDLHELLEKFNLSEMISFYELKYPYVHEREDILKKISDFESADSDFEPICLRGKDWDMIKLDLIEAQMKLIQ